MVLGGKEGCQTATLIATPTGEWLIYHCLKYFLSSANRTTEEHELDEDTRKQLRNTSGRKSKKSGMKSDHIHIHLVKKLKVQEVTNSVNDEWSVFS